MDPAPLSQLFDETVALFHHLRAAAETVHGEGELSAARRGVLRSLETHGPKTVPDLARMRPVSRQHIQTIVDALAADGLVELKNNPAHKRSSLVALTAAGRALLAEMREREEKFLREAGFDVSEPDLRKAAETLRRVRQTLAQKLE